MPDTTQASPTLKDISLTRSAIKNISFGIEAECRKKKKRIPKGREMLKEAVKRYRNSIESGNDNYLGTAAPLQ